MARSNLLTGKAILTIAVVAALTNVALAHAAKAKRG